MFTLGKSVFNEFVVKVNAKEDRHASIGVSIMSGIHASDNITDKYMEKLENRYINEFVDEYKKLGVDYFHFCDNNNNGTEKLSDMLQKEIKEGTEIKNITIVEIVWSCHLFFFKAAKIPSPMPKGIAIIEE